MEKVSVFIKIRVLFWPEISALGVFFNFDNERMRPPKYPSAPPGGEYQRRDYANVGETARNISEGRRMDAVK